MAATSEPRPTQREYWNSRVGDEWAAQADSIDRMLLPFTAAAAAALRLQPGERVLDIGCGAGASTMELARQVGAGGCVTGIDLSRPLLDVARRRAGAEGLPVEFVEADASAAVISGKLFDAGFSRFGVMFFEDPIAAFAHIRRAVRSGGRLVFVCWRALAENAWALAPMEAAAPLFKAAPPAFDPDAPGPFALAERGKIERILQNAGWRDVDVQAWDGSIAIGGGGDAAEAAAFMLKIGPCARIIADQDLDHAAVMHRVMDRLSEHQGPLGVLLPAACWIVRAIA